MASHCVTVTGAVLETFALPLTVSSRLLSIARDIDNLTYALERDSRYMAKRFVEFADRVAAGRQNDSPTSYSTLRDIERNDSALRALKGAFEIACSNALGEAAWIEIARALAECPSRGVD